MSKILIMMSMNVEKNFLSFPCLLMKGKEFQRFHCFLEFTIGMRVIFQVPGGTLWYSILKMVQKLFLMMWQMRGGNDNDHNLGDNGKVNKKRFKIMKTMICFAKYSVFFRPQNRELPYQECKFCPKGLNARVIQLQDWKGHQKTTLLWHPIRQSPNTFCISNAQHF